MCRHRIPWFPCFLFTFFNSPHGSHIWRNLSCNICEWCGCMFPQMDSFSLITEPTGIPYFIYLNHISVFILLEQECSRDRLQCPWQWWHWGDGCTGSQRKVIYSRWPIRSSGLKLSLLIWLLLCLFTQLDSTLLLQLLQTEKVMGLRFCPDKGVRTLSLLLTPLSHHREQESVVGGTEGLSVKAYHPVLVWNHLPLDSHWPLCIWSQNQQRRTDGLSCWEKYSPFTVLSDASKGLQGCIFLD